MQIEEKLERFNEFMAHLEPLLTVEGDNGLEVKIRWQGEEFLSATRRIFRIQYAGMNSLADASPFTSVRIIYPYRWDEPELRLNKSDDVPAVTMLRTDSVEKRKSETAEFWHSLRQRIIDLKAEAKDKGLEALRKLRLRQAYHEGRAWWIARQWLRTTGWIDELIRIYHPVHGGFVQKSSRVYAYSEEEAQKRLLKSLRREPGVRQAWINDGKPVAQSAYA